MHKLLGAGSEQHQDVRCERDCESLLLADDFCGWAKSTHFIAFLQEHEVSPSSFGSQAAQPWMQYHELSSLPDGQRGESPAVASDWTHGIKALRRHLLHCLQMCSLCKQPVQCAAMQVLRPCSVL